jgi:hypothetical protein
MGFSASGTEDWGILTLIMSILGAAASFLDEKRARALGSLVAGILALLGVIIYWSRISGASVGAGLILALIVSLVLIALAYMDFKNIPLPIKFSGTPKSNNPPPTPPPSPPPAPPAQ